MSKQLQTLAISPEFRTVEQGFASLTEAGRFLTLSRSSLYKLMDGGQLAYALFGRSRRVPWAALKEYASKSMVGQAEGGVTR
jgi:excisionase family DNA binding protein